MGAGAERWAVLLALGYVPGVSCYSSLGTPVLNTTLCDIFSYECPSHFMCLPDEHSGTVGSCVCDRFFAFKGPTCRKLSPASFMLAAFCVICLAGSLLCVWRNLALAWQLNLEARLTPEILFWHIDPTSTPGEVRWRVYRLG